MLPEANLFLQFTSKNESNGNEFMAGASVNYQILTPRISVKDTISKSFDSVKNTFTFKTATFATDTKSPALAANLFVKMKLKNFTVKLGGEFGENNYAYTMLGGYAVKTAVTDSTRESIEYSNVRSFAVWGDFHTNGTKWQPGLFGAFGRNLGVGEPVAGPYYSRGANIDYAYRISPRLNFNVKKLRIAGEVEYTVAAYGTANKSGVVENAKEIGNVRLLLGVFYFF
jgi:hypothetical protein